MMPIDTRMAFRLSLALSLLSLSVLCTLWTHAQEWDSPTEESELLLASDSAENDRFGKSVSIDGDVIVVGAYYDHDADVTTGAAYAFRRQSDGTWLEETQLAPESGEEGDSFGYAVSNYQNRLIVGAPNSGESGVAEIYRYDSFAQSWDMEIRLTPSDAAVAWFGRGIALTDHIAVVGAPGSDGDEDNTGAAFVFVRTNNSRDWVEEQELVDPLGSENDRFGSFVAVDGGVIVVGAPGFDDIGVDFGAAHVFEYDEDEEEWQRVEVLTGNEDDSRFGKSAAVSGDVIVIGSAEGAHVYRRSATSDSWEEEQLLTPATPSGWFGGSVSVLAQSILVGSTGDDEAGSNAGAAFLFTNGPDGWVESQKFIASDAGSHDYLGTSVVLSGTDAVVGTWAWDGDSIDSGAAYVYSLDCEACFKRGDVNGDDVVAALLDGLSLMQYAFAFGAEPPCLDAADVDDDGVVDGLLDSAFLLNSLFSDGPAPGSPGASCGADPTTDDIECETPPDSCI